MKGLIGILGILTALGAAGAVAAADDQVFAPRDHCVAYRTIKDILFAVDAEVIGRSCEVSARVALPETGEPPRLVVEVPVKSLKSGNFLRNRAVADLLGAETQENLRFTSSLAAVERIRDEVGRGRLLLPGVLSIGGRDFPVEFPLEAFEHEGRHYVTGRLATTFAAFEIEVPTIAFGLVARPHEALELIVHLELERVDGLEDWARNQGLR